MIFMLGYVATLVPYHICFGANDTEAGYTFTGIIEIIVDFLFFVDIIVNFLSAYDDPITNLPVIDMKLIAQRYISSWFFLDLLAVFPFEGLEAIIRSGDGEMQDGNLDSVKLTRLARLPRLYKLLRVLRLLKMLRVFRKSG